MVLIMARSKPSNHINTIQHKANQGRPLTPQERRDLAAWRNGTYGTTPPADLRPKDRKPISPAAPAGPDRKAVGSVGPAPDSAMFGDASPATGEQTNWVQFYRQMFKDYGLDGLDQPIYDWVVKQGISDGNQILMMLRQTDQYKKRFAGNEERRRQGMSVLDEGTYLATEAALKNVYKQWGLPPDFYDSPDDFAKLISRDISPDELNKRAGMAWKYLQSTNSDARRALRDFYGIDDSHLLTTFLDPDRAQPILDRMAASAEMGASGSRRGIGVSKRQAESWVDQGLSTEQVDQGLSQASQVLPDMTKIASRFDTSYSQVDAVNEFVTGDAAAKRKRQELSGRESALFAGSAGAASGASETAKSY